jgi:hypothetical protein
LSWINAGFTPPDYFNKLFVCPVEFTIQKTLIDLSLGPWLSKLRKWDRLGHTRNKILTKKWSNAKSTLKAYITSQAKEERPTMCARSREHSLCQHEQALCDTLSDVINELLLVNPADFIAFIRTEKLANIQDIVDSSTEIHFPRGRLNFAHDARFNLNWNSSPQISIRMNLQHADLNIAFWLHLGDFSPYVTINRLETTEKGLRTSAGLERFKGLLETAHQASRHTAPPENQLSWNNVRALSSKCN